MNNFTYETIKKYLNYPDEFWLFLSDRITFIEPKQENEEFYVTLMKFNEFDLLIDIKVIVPFIKDIKTALINIHEYKHAYDLYLKLNQKIENESNYETEAENLELSFSNYILKRTKKLI